MNKLEGRVKALEKRNERVEQDKAWETSTLRRVSITILTYFTVLGYLLIIDADKPFVSATVPSLGYFLSTLVIKSAKSKWTTSQK